MPTHQGVTPLIASENITHYVNLVKHFFQDSYFIQKEIYYICRKAFIVPCLRVISDRLPGNLSPRKSRISKDSPDGKHFKKLDNFQGKTDNESNDFSVVGMVNMNKKTELLRSLKFLLFSISAGLIEIVSFALLNETLHWPYWPCYLIALVLSVLWNFTLNRRYTFRSANNVPVAMAKVFLFYLVFTPASTIFGNWLAEGLHWNEYLVTAINMVLNFILEFLYDRFFVFKDSIDTNDIAKKKDVRE